MMGPGAMGPGALSPSGLPHHRKPGEIEAGIVAFKHGPPSFKAWWEWTMIAIIAVSGLVGIFAFVWYSYRSIRSGLKVRISLWTVSIFLRKQTKPGVHALPRNVEERIHLLSRMARDCRKTCDLPAKPTKFGVYLGFLNDPVTEDEARILSQWDAVVLDYCEPGILDAVSNGTIALGPHIIARLDLLEILRGKARDTEIDLSKVVYIISRIVRQTLRQPDKKRYFTGVLVAGWRERISIPLLHGLTKLLSAYGLEVFLEIPPPDFLHDIEKLEINLFSGVVVRNGTILPTGERRDFFSMEKMKTTTKAFVSQSCQRPFITFMWDTINDQTSLSHAVVRRAHMWCSYHGAIPYFVRNRALTSIFDIRIREEPLAAFQWLKDRRVMDVHEKYRSSRMVRAHEFIKPYAFNTDLS
jgi:hypothetical protein